MSFSKLGVVFSSALFLAAFSFQITTVSADEIDFILDEIETYGEPGKGGECTNEQCTTEECPSLYELICICISEMITKKTWPPDGDANKQFKEDAEAITDAVACRKKEWGRIGQVACDKKLCDEAKDGEAPDHWPGNSKRNFENCKEAAMKTIEKCKAEDEDDSSLQGGGSGGGGGGSGKKLDCNYKHWYHQDDDKHQKPDGDKDPYNNDPAWCPKEKFDDPSTKKSKYGNYGKPDPVHLVRPKGVKGKDKPGPYDEGGGGKNPDGTPKDGKCKDYKFPAS